MASLTDEEIVLTVPDGASVGPKTDAIDIRAGTFQVLTVGTMGVTTLTTDAINEATIGNGTTVNGLNIASGAFGGQSFSALSSTVAVNSGVAIAPAGTGAFTLAIPNGLPLGGNVRGQYAVDLQLSRAAATNVASGDYSAILSGNGNTAGATRSVVVGGANNICTGAGYNFVGGGLNNTVNGATVVICSIVNGTGCSITGATNLTQGSSILSGSNCAINNAQHTTILSGTNHVVDWPLAVANAGGGVIACGNLCTITNAEGYIFGSNTSNVSNSSRVMIVCSDANTVDNSTGLIWASNANVTLGSEVSVGADTAVVTNCLNSSALFGTAITLTNADNSLAGGQNATTTFANTVVLGDGVTPTAATAANEMTLNYSAGLRLVGNVVRLSDLSEIYSMQTVVTTVGVVSVTLIAVPISPAIRYCNAQYSIIGHNAAGDVASIVDHGVVETSTAAVIADLLNPVIFESPAFAGTIYSLTPDAGQITLKVSGHAAQTINWSATLRLTGSN